MQREKSQKHLTLVPPTEPDPKQSIVERIKRPMRQPGSIQCSKCGGRTIMTTVTGSWIDEIGKYRRGTVTDDRICYHCHMQGIWSPMISEPPRLAKEPKPRRAKPKIIK